MVIIGQSWEFMKVPEPERMLETIEAAARTCYQSVMSGDEWKRNEFLEHLIRRGHESVFEHESISVRIKTDRAVSHELVRHRLASYSQESQRYVRYEDGIEFVMPIWLRDDRESEAFVAWEESCLYSEMGYKRLIGMGKSPQEARSVLNNSVATEIVMTANLREWRHVFKMRTDPRAYPQMRDLMLNMLAGFRVVPVVFDNIE